MARFASGGQGVGFATLTRLTTRQRIAPDTANSFYVVAKNDRGTAFAHHFTRNSGGADSGDTGAPWGNWRYVGTAELPGFAASPTDPARFVYSDDTGAQDYALRATANGLFMGSYHGGATPTAEAVRIDGMAVDTLVAAAGNRVSLTHTVSVVSGATTLNVTCEVHVDPVDGSLGFALPGTSSTGAFTQAFFGMGLTTGTHYDQCDMILHGGTTEFSLPVAIGTTYLGAARAIRLRDSATGRAVRITMNAAGQANFRRCYLLRTAVRTKWYAEGASGALATKSNIVWRVAFETGRGAVTTPGANLLSNGGFDSDLAGWTAGMTGGSVTWNAGKLRALRGAATENRISQPVTLAAGGIYLLSGEQTTPAGTSGSLGLCNNAVSTSSPAPAYAPVPAPADGITAHVVIPTAAASWAMLVQSTGTAGQVTDFDQLSLIKLADGA